MAIELPPLPFARDALEPHISAETMDYHYGKHHQGYADQLNKQILGTEFEAMALEDIVRSASGPMFNNAAQVWNHSFYWNCLSPRGGGEPEGRLAVAINHAFGSFEQFRQYFNQAALTLFGAGWIWLVQRPDGHLALVSASNAGTPITGEDRPLLTCDVWEHAYYIDHRNARPRYVETFWKLVNWAFVNHQLR
jgi:superoxide dismutase, Fe-Mn family